MEPKELIYSTTSDVLKSTNNVWYTSYYQQKYQAFCYCMYMIVQHPFSMTL